MKEEVKKLHRSKKDKVIAGVCGGLGEYFNMDPVIFRILFVVLALAANGLGIILYIVLAIILPEGPGGEKKKRK